MSGTKYTLDHTPNVAQEILTALEARGNLFATNIEQQTERYRDVQVVPKDISLERGAKTSSSLKISQSFYKRATWLDRWLAKGQPQLPQAEIVVKKRMLRIKKMAKELVVLELIVKFLFLLPKGLWCV
ncbi:hypothetical protein YC2023_033695 [Brassica napus]